MRKERKTSPARILTRWSGHGMPLSGAPFSGLIGIALREGGEADYARMHREADTELHQARAEGRNRIVAFDAATAVSLQPGPRPASWYRAVYAASSLGGLAARNPTQPSDGKP
jgi:hypothetical protein